MKNPDAGEDRQIIPSPGLGRLTDNAFPWMITTPPPLITNVDVYVCFNSGQMGSALMGSLQDVCLVLVQIRKT